MPWRLSWRSNAPPTAPESMTEEDEPRRDTPPPRTVTPVVVPRWVQLVLLPLSILGLWALARASGPVLLILVVASLVALILNPVVKMMERGRIPRGIAIFVVYVGCFALLAGIGIALSQPISDQVSRFSARVPHLVKTANRDLNQVQEFLNDNGIHVHFATQGRTALQSLQHDITKSTGSIASFARDLAGKVVTILFDLVLTLVLSVYLLVYGKQIGELARRIMPPGDGTPDDDFPLLIQKAVSGYVRGQLSFSLVMGASAAVGLAIFGLVGIYPDGLHYALFFGGFYGLMEFIPYIGPVIGPVPAVLVALFDHPLTAVWVIILFVALQQLEGHFVAPQVFRISLRINPIIIILSLLVGYQLYGVAGALVALPSAAVIRQTIVYLRGHLVLEQWSVVAPPTAGALPLGPDECPDCGTRAGPDDAFCRSCGASLEPKVRTPD